METPRISPQLADKKRIRMIDVGEKTPTARRAIASGRISMASETIQRIRSGQMPKGDVLAVAEIAGIMAAKRTSVILPLCHPLSLEHASIEFKFLEHSIEASCMVSMTAKTGVEMEALTGVMASLLSIYDLTKGVDPVLSISEVRLERKEGGKSGVWIHPGRGACPEAPLQKLIGKLDLSQLQAAVITVSDRCSQGQSPDASGRQIMETLRDWNAQVSDTVIVPDDIEKIRIQVLRISQELKANLVILTGGTGLGPRDLTPEALAPLYTKPIPGIGELLRAMGSSETQMAWLSRSGAGFMGQALIISLPGSPRAVRSGLSVLRELLPHLLHISQGGAH